MPRYRLVLEFDGGPFIGWQRQDNGPSVQAAVERAIHAMLGQNVTAIAAGRTDAGVHAMALPVHVDIAMNIPVEKLQAGLNFHLRPDPIAIVEAMQTDDDFHARFSAISRRYLYCIANRRPPPVLERGRVWHVARRLSVERMQEAGQVLVGKHDFTSFRSTACQARSPLKTLDVLSAERIGGEVLVRASARSFMHNQVRSMVGSLKLVGEGKWTGLDLAAALEARQRAACGPVAPAHGLYLQSVDY